jgi:hypothetical protein
MSTFATVEITLMRYRNGSLSAHRAIEKLYEFYPECEDAIKDEAPELIELMDQYIDMLVTRAEQQAEQS